MSYEAGSPECRKIIDAKENLLKIMQSLNNLENVDSIQFKLKDIYDELETMHEARKKIEKK